MRDITHRKIVIMTLGHNDFFKNRILSGNQKWSECAVRQNKALYCLFFFLCIETTKIFCSNSLNNCLNSY